MTWSYGGDPSANDKDQIRFMIGDTDTDDQLLSDEEIAGAVTIYGNQLAAAISCCYAIAATFARKADTANTAGLRVSASQRYRQYKDLAEQLRTQNALDAAMGATIWIGGAEQSDVDAMNESSTYVQPQFKIGADDYFDRSKDEDTPD